MNLAVDIAGITCSFEGLDEDFGRVLSERYRPFVTVAKPEFYITMELDDSLQRVSVSSDRERLVEVVTDARFPEKIHLRRVDNPFRATVDFETGRGELVCGRNIYCFDSYLRVLYSVLLGRRGHVLLHAAAVGVSAGGGVDLLVGESEAGKTTASRQGFERVLSDELVAVGWYGEDLVAWGTPFWGEFVAGRVSEMERVRKLYLLRKGETERVHEVSRARAALEVLGCTFFFGPPELARGQLAMVSDLVERVLRGELDCTPTPAVVAFLFPDEVEEACCG